MKLNKLVSGFTLVELIVVIVVLAVLSAVALPKFFNITSDAQTASTNAVASSLSAANAENSSVRTANTSKGQSVANCTDIGNILQGGLPSGYTIVSGSAAVGSVTTCTVNGPKSTSASFNATGVN